MVWYSHLFKNFPVCCDPHKGFGIVNKAEVEYIMRNPGLNEAQAGIKIAGRNINNLRYAEDTTLMAESEEELHPSAVSCFVCKYFCLLSGWSFCFDYGFLCCAKVFKFN